MSTTTTPATLTGEYTLDPAHSRIGFVARHAMITKVRGSFNEVSGHGHFDAENPENSTAEVVIAAKSIDTRNADRDAHLRTNDFLAAEEYPEIRFTTTGIARRQDGDYEVSGDLSIRGVTKPVTIPFEFTGTAKDPFGNERIGFEGSTVINRNDWNVNFNAVLEAGGFLVGEKVTLEFEISAIKSA
jgi:polyisoprenoid-binding protein YceI